MLRRVQHTVCSRVGARQTHRWGIKRPDGTDKCDHARPSDQVTTRRVRKPGDRASTQALPDNWPDTVRGIRRFDSFLSLQHESEGLTMNCKCGGVIRCMNCGAVNEQCFEAQSSIPSTKDGRTMLGGRRYKIIRELLDGEWTNGVAAYEDRDDLVVTPKVFDALEDARADALLCDLQLLIGNWENEHKFLSGENDSQYDKGAGSAFGICAGLLKEIIKTHNARLDRPETAGGKDCHE